MHKARSERKQRANRHAAHDDGVPADGLRERPAENGADAEGDDVERQGEQGDGAADAEFQLEEIDGGAGDGRCY